MHFYLGMQGLGCVGLVGDSEEMGHTVIRIQLNMSHPMLADPEGYWKVRGKSKRRLELDGLSASTAAHQKVYPRTKASSIIATDSTGEIARARHLALWKKLSSFFLSIYHSSISPRDGRPCQDQQQSHLRPVHRRLLRTPPLRHCRQMPSQLTTMYTFTSRMIS
jgi:hypothetical protein